MDEENNFPEQTSNPTSKKRIRRGKNRSKNGKLPDWRNRFLVHQKWTLTEKSRLLEALKRYEPDSISSIAKVVGTKSEEEVEQKIQHLRGIDAHKYASHRVDGDKPDRAPIEAWIDLVQEMTSFESADYSQFVPKLLGLIVRNEHFEDSGYPELKWRNIYQFLADITEDKVDTQKLTDLEYLIVLDMMRNLGEELQKSDTTNQRQILDFKYNLLNYKSGQPSKTEKETIGHNVSQALSNDFWEPEEMQSLLSHASESTTSASPAQPSSSYSTSSSSSQPSSNATSKSAVRMCMTSESPASRDLQATRTSSTQRSGLQEAGTSSGQGGSGQPNNSSEVTITIEDHDKASSGAGLFHAQGSGQKFLRPKFFTLNPLCVPTQLLTFQPKT